jgi:hypothetical protein
MKADCPMLNCPVLNISTKPITAIAQIPLDINMDRVIILVVKTGRIRNRAISTQITVLGIKVL